MRLVLERILLSWYLALREASEYPLRKRARDWRTCLPKPERWPTLVVRTSLVFIYAE